MGWIPVKNPTLTLLYKASVDGYTGADFHRQCDNKGSTFTIFKSNHGSIFGGYTSQSWTSSGKFITDAQAFLYSMTLGVQLKNSDIIGNRAYLDYKLYGPSFGSDDIRIKGDPSVEEQNCIRNTYLGPYGETNRGWAPYLCGGSKYTLEEIEVYGVSSS